MGWGTDDVLRASLDDQQVAILDARDKLHTLATLTFVDGFSEVLVQVFDEYIGILRLEITTVVGDDLAIFERDDITTDGEVVVSHLVADRGRFEWPSAFVHLIQIVTQNGSIGHLRAWGESLRNGHQSSAAAFTSQLVHHRFMGILQQGLPTEPFDGKICHAITKYDDMLHMTKYLRYS